MAPASDDSVELYFKDRHYNVLHLDDGKTFDNAWYANVSLPAVFDGKTPAENAQRILGV